MTLKYPHRKCQSHETINKKTVIAMLPAGSGTRTFLESLDDDAWTVFAFNSQTREVCINIDNENVGYTGVNLTVTLPELTF